MVTMKPLIIHAPNVRAGGGKTLLISLIAAIKGKRACIAILDDRLIISEESLSGIEVHRISASINGRLGAEFLLQIFQVD